MGIFAVVSLFLHSASSLSHGMKWKRKPDWPLVAGWFLAVGWNGVLGVHIISLDSGLGVLGILGVWLKAFAGVI